MSDFATPDGQATFIQWKNTNLCMDFTCPSCGRHCHYDGLFMHYIRCRCNAVYELGTWVAIRKVPTGEKPHIPPGAAEPEEDD